MTMAVFVILVQGIAGPPEAAAAPITYQFSSTVAFVDTALVPASLAGVAVGDPIVATMTFDTSTPPSSSNPIPFDPWADASYYSLTGATFSVSIDGVVLDTWTGLISAFMWNDDQFSVGGPAQDGYVFTNVTASGNPLFQWGALGLSSSLFGDESLPSGGALSGVFELNRFGSSGPELWVRSGSITATVVEPSAVPEPATLLLVGAGLAAAARRRRHGRARG
jgi:hypothetical protein